MCVCVCVCVRQKLRKLQSENLVGEIDLIYSMIYENAPLDVYVLENLTSVTMSNILRSTCVLIMYACSLSQYRFTVPHKVSERYCTSERNHLWKEIAIGR